MKNILNPNGTLNINKLDQVVESFYGTKNPQAEKILLEFRNHPSTWKKIPEICKVSRSEFTKFLTIDILRDVVKYKWAVLPLNEKKGMRNFIMQNISSLSQVKLGSPLLGRYNVVLVEIIKKEWPANWKSLIPEIVRNSQNNEKFCENSMRILRILSEDIFEFAEGTLTSKKIVLLKNSLLHEFEQIFKLCKLVFLKSTRISVVRTTLRTLANYLKWVPRQWIFKTDILGILTVKMLSNEQGKSNNFKEFRFEVFKCLQVLATMNEMQYNGILMKSFVTVMKICVKEIPPTSTNFSNLYGKLCSRDQKFIFQFAFFLKTFMQNHLKQVEQEPQLAKCCHIYLVGLSRVQGDRELFKVCADYWNFFVKNLFYDEQQTKGGLLLTQKSSFNSQRKMFYNDVLAQLRNIIIDNMAKPEEVIIVEGSDGELIKEYLKDVDAIQMYNCMRFTLVHLMKLDPKELQRILLRHLKTQLVNDNMWSWKRLNSLCWSIGSVAGVLGKNDELKFLVLVLRDLLELCRKKTGKENKAIVASNIMYVVQKYPRFLMINWVFLKTVTMKLFEFMHVKFPGVQEMACETFLKISKEAKIQYIKNQKGENEPFVVEILRNLGAIMKELEGRDVHLFFQAVGEIINAANQNQQQALVKQLMLIPNNKWRAIMDQKNYKDMDTMRSIGGLLRTFSHVAKSTSKCFIFQMKFIFRDVVGLYQFYSKEITQEISQRGKEIVGHFYVKKMIDNKVEILDLFEVFISNTDSNQTTFIYQNFLAKFFQMILEDYGKNIPESRNPKVLSVMSQLVKKYRDQQHLIQNLPKILETCFKFTLPLITKDFKLFPEHRINFFKLIRSINNNCFQTFFKIPANGFSTVMKSILWAIRHRERNNYEEGLNILNELIEKIKKLNSPRITNSFFGNYFIAILNDLFCVLTDSFHQTLVDVQCNILQNLFYVIANDVVTVKIYKEDINTNNKIYLRNFFGNLLAKNFPNLNKRQIGDFTVNLFKFSSDKEAFFKILKDFLVEMKEHTNVNTYQVFEDKRRLAIDYKKSKENIPSLPAPGQVRNEEEDEPMMAIAPPPRNQMNQNMQGMDDDDDDMMESPTDTLLSLPAPRMNQRSMQEDLMNNFEEDIEQDLDDDDEVLAIADFAHNE